MAFTRVLAFVAAASVASAISAVTTLNATKYLGKWYQMYDDLTEVFIETKYCVTANYDANKNGTISVWNRDRQDNVTGEITQIYGWAEVPNPQQPGELTVHLQGVPVAAPYWVVGLGEPSYGPDGLYEWAIVSDPFELSLFVLARNVNLYNKQWNATVFALLEKEGFTGIINSPIPTVQDGCPDDHYNEQS